MGTSGNPPKACPPKLVISAKALKLAEKWVDCMSKCSEDEEQQEYEGRPARLGLGAKVARQSQVGPLNDPIQRKLHAKLNAAKRKASQLGEEIVPSSADTDDASEDDEDSRTRAFSKRRAAPLTASLKAKKK